MSDTTSMFGDRDAKHTSESIDAAFYTLLSSLPNPKTTWRSRLFQSRSSLKALAWILAVDQQQKNHEPSSLMISWTKKCRRVVLPSMPLISTSLRSVSSLKTCASPRLVPTFMRFSIFRTASRSFEEQCGSEVPTCTLTPYNDQAETERGDGQHEGRSVEAEARQGTLKHWRVQTHPVWLTKLQKLLVLVIIQNLLHQPVPEWLLDLQFLRWSRSKQRKMDFLTLKPQALASLMH